MEVFGFFELIFYVLLEDVLVAIGVSKGISIYIIMFYVVLFYFVIYFFRAQVINFLKAIWSILVSIINQILNFIRFILSLFGLGV
jgi:hypothetical protein